jgi:DNA-directed RNA polymerase specialized sigma24 family protein
MSPPDNQGCFPPTNWTLIGRLRSGDESTARRALEDLCAQYRHPLYCAIRHRGLVHHDAEDALQDFLLKLVRVEAFGEAQAEKGRLRSYLSTALGRFLLNWHRDRAARLGEVSLDAPPLGEEAGARYGAEHFPDHETPERLFDREWARALLAGVFDRLAVDYAARGKAAIFSVLSPVLRRGGSLRGEDTPAMAAALGQSAAGLRKTHQRFLADYRALLEGEVLETVASRDEVGAEIAHLLACFGDG